ncbi:choice-of-anchor D domain-containing protein, partial [uncultured Flavobacterium sp.]
MKTRLLFLALFMSAFSWGQVQLSEGTPSQTIDFSSTIAGVSNGAYTGTGFQATPSAGQLDSDAWAVTGWSDGALVFGGTRTMGDYARGAATVAVTTGGFYSYRAAPHSVANPCFMIQPGGSDFAPGTLTLRIRNNGAGFMNQVNVSYNLFVRNDQARSSSFNFSYSSDNSTYTAVSALDYTSPAASTGTAWVQVGTSPSRSTSITGLSIAPGDYFYIRWNSEDVGGSGSRDEFGLDDISMTASFGAPSAPVITSDLTASGFVGSPFSYTITATNAPTSFNADFLPAGFSIDTATGIITATPGVTGTFLVAISAINAGGIDEQTLVITITDPGPEINIRGATGGTNPIVSGNTIPNAFNNTLFASVLIGNNQIKDYRIQNIGVSNLNLTGTPRVVITGPHASDFTVIAQPATPILAGNNVVFQIRFTPSTGGVRTAVVSIANNDSDENPYTFTIQGTGSAPDISVIGNGLEIPNGSTTPDLLNHSDFGNVNETAGTKVRNFYVTNFGGENLTLTLPVTITGPNAADFTVTTVPSSPVAPNNSTTLSITFNPSALGLREATVTIINDVIGKSPYVFAISGVGIDFDECQLSGLSNVRIQNFDAGSTWPYTTATELGANPPVVTGGSAHGDSRFSTSIKYAGASGNSLQVTGPFPSNNDPKAKVIVTFDTVDVSQYSQIDFDMKIGAYSTTANPSQGLDISDWVSIYVSVDGGLTWSKELIVKGLSNSIWNINTSSGSYSGAYKGINIPNEVQSPSGSINQGVRFLSISNLPLSSQLRVKVELENDINTEVWVIDDIRLRGRTPLSKSWNGTAWTSGTPPTSIERAIFAGNYNTNTHGDVTACECQINGGRTVTITDGNYIQSSGRIVNNGTLIVENNGSLVQLDDYAVNIGNASVRRTANIRRLDYVYWSSPVIDFPVLSISTGTPASNVFKWLPTISGNFGNWTTANENMVQGKGYIVRGPSSFNNTIQPFNAAFVGVPNNGIFTPTIERGGYTGGGYPSPTNPLITVTANDDNFNLIGNPYPSAIRALDFLNENTNIEGSVRIWTHGLLPNVAFNDPFYNNFAYNYSPNDYIVHNGTGTVSGPLGFNGFIASGQGFFVLMNDGAATTETVTFKNSMRNITHANNQFFRNASELNGESDFKIWLDFIPQNGTPVRTLLGYVDGATNEKDRLFDASTKIDGSSKMYSLIDNKPYIIQGRSLPFDENDIVPMGYNTTTAGTFTVAIADVMGLDNKRVYLKDKLLNNIHDLTASPYVFDSNAGVVNDRFELRYTNETLSNPNFSEIASSVIAFGSNGQLHIKSSLEKINSVLVYDVLGRVVFSQKEQSTNEFVANTNFSKQTVIVQIELENGQIVTK